MKNLVMLLTCVAALVPVGAVSGENEQAAGRKLYNTYCAPCHGVSGKGDGSGGGLLLVKPADHTDGRVMNAYSDKYLFDVISKGGAALGKSPYMPAWNGLLKEKQVRTIITYIRSLAVPPYDPVARK